MRGKEAIDINSHVTDFQTLNILIGFFNLIKVNAIR